MALSSPRGSSPLPASSGFGCSSVSAFLSGPFSALDPLHGSLRFGADPTALFGPSSLFRGSNGFASSQSLARFCGQAGVKKRTIVLGAVFGVLALAVLAVFAVWLILRRRDQTIDEDNDYEIDSEGYTAPEFVDMDSKLFSGATAMMGSICEMGTQGPVQLQGMHQ
jgi:hypothetical protein